MYKKEKKGEERGSLKEVYIDCEKMVENRLRHQETYGILLYGELEPVFTAEDAVWPRDFSVRQGEFSPEYFVYCKKIQRSMAEKAPARRRLRL